MWLEHANTSFLAVAQVLWRDQTSDGWGGEGRYHEPGLVLTVDNEESSEYSRGAMINVKRLAEESASMAAGFGINGERKGLRGMMKPIEELRSQDEIRRATGYENALGIWGYINWNSGWADAEACVRYALRRIKRDGKGRVEIRAGVKVERLLVEEQGKDKRCAGVMLESGEKIMADLTVVAAGAWTPSLIDLQGRCLATGQVLAYLDITDDEQKRLQDKPTILNMSRGMFVIPPRSKELKVARHGFGYRNMMRLDQGKVLGAKADVEVSVPWNGVEVPREGREACRDALQELLPEMADRPFTKTRVCWYCDTPDGNFLIDHLPDVQGLFLATGGSGHGFKFFPVIGEKIVDAIQGKLQLDLKQCWRWKEKPVPDFQGCDDGSRAGRRGMILADELKK